MTYLSKKTTDCNDLKLIRTKICLRISLHISATEVIPRAGFKGKKFNTYRLEWSPKMAPSVAIGAIFF